MRNSRKWENMQNYLLSFEQNFPSEWEKERERRGKERGEGGNVREGIIFKTQKGVKIKCHKKVENYKWKTD
jgi:hypothetical protein